LRRRMEELLTQDGDPAPLRAPARSRRNTAPVAVEPLGLRGPLSGEEEDSHLDEPPPRSRPAPGHAPPGSGAAEDASRSWIHRHSAPNPLGLESLRRSAEELLLPEAPSPPSGSQHQPGLLDSWASGDLQSPGSDFPPEGAADPFALDRDLQRRAAELLGLSSQSFGSRRSWYDRGEPQGVGQGSRGSLRFSSTEEPDSPEPGAARHSSSSGPFHAWFHGSAAVMPEARH